MPIDPRHKRDIPSGRKIAALVAATLLLMRRQTIDAVRMGQVLPPYYVALWSLYRQLVPELEKYLLAGAKYSIANRPLLDTESSRNPKKVDFLGNSEHQPLNFNSSTARFEQFKSWAKVESERQAMALIREINDTTRKEVQKAIDAGRTSGEPLSRIQANIMGIPAPITVQDRVAELAVFDKARAELIGENESSRALHAGQYEMGKRLGAIGTIWHTSNKPCEKCEPLDGQRRLYGQTYYVHDDRTPPAYRYIYHPLLHPRCYCTVTDWWPD